MGLLAKVLRPALRLANTQSVPLPTAGGMPWVQRYSLPGERDYQRQIGDGSNNSLIQAGIAFITNGFLEAPVRVRQRTGDELVVVANHPMVEQIRRPNPFYSGSLLWMATIANWIGDGNGYWIIKDTSGAGRPVSVYWAPSWLVEPKGPDDGSEFMTHYEYRPNGRKIDLDPMQVVHFRYGIDPQNPRKGFSRVKAVMRELYTDEEAARFTATLLRNMGAPGIVLSPKGEGGLTPQEGADLKIEVLQKTSGEHRGEPLVALSGTDVHEYGFSPEQMDLSGLRAIPESRAAAALDIPAAVLGFLSGMKQTAVGATLAELRELGYESGVIPKQRLIAEELHTQFLPHYTDRLDDYQVDFDLSEVRVLQEDQNKLVDRVVRMVGGPLATRSEGRQLVGMTPEPGDDVYLDPIAVIATPQGQIAPVPQNVRPIAARRLAKRATPQQVSYLRRIDREAAHLSTQFGEELRAAFDDLGARAAAAWEQTRSSFTRLKADPQDEAFVAALLELLDLDPWTQGTLTPLWSRHYQRTAELTYGALKQHLGVDVGTDIPDPIARAVVSAGGRQLGLIDLTQQTRDALFEALTQARTEGLGPVESARRIRQFVSAGRYSGLEAERKGAGVRYRTEMIARTETKYAQNVAVAEVGRTAGFGKYLAFDNRTGYDDAECVARDGQEYTYDEMLAEIANEHPQGTLGFAPVPGSQAA